MSKKSEWNENGKCVLFSYNELGRCLLLLIATVSLLTLLTHTNSFPNFPAPLDLGAESSIFGNDTFAATTPTQSVSDEDILTIEAQGELILSRRLRVASLSGLKFYLSSYADNHRDLQQYSDVLCQFLTNQSEFLSPKWRDVLSPVLKFFCNANISKTDFYSGTLLLTDLSKDMKSAYDDICSAKIKSAEDILWEKMWRTQFPENCLKPGLLIYDFSNVCGFGCTLHHMLITFSTALALNRTLYVDSRRMKYGSGAWEKLFFPVTNCSMTPKEVHEAPSMFRGLLNNSVTKFQRHFDPWDGREYLPPALPRWLLDHLQECHDNPEAWYQGQLLNFVMMPQPATSDLTSTTQMGLSDYAGIQIRTTDKMSEANIRSLPTYDLYLHHLEKTHHRNFTDWWIATDNITVADRMQALFPNKRIKTISGTALMNKTQQNLESDRYTNNSLYGIYLDLFMLSRSDLLVGTMSSNVIRVAYELSLASPSPSAPRDTTWNAISLDVEYHLFQRFTPETLNFIRDNPYLPTDSKRYSPALRYNYPPDGYKNWKLSSGFISLCDKEKHHKEFVPRFLVERIYSTY